MSWQSSRPAHISSSSTWLGGCGCLARLTIETRVGISKYRLSKTCSLLSLVNTVVGVSGPEEPRSSSQRLGFLLDGWGVSVLTRWETMTLLMLSNQQYTRCCCQSLTRICQGIGFSRHAYCGQSFPQSAYVVTQAHKRPDSETSYYLHSYYPA